MQSSDSNVIFVLDPCPHPEKKNSIKLQNSSMLNQLIPKDELMKLIQIFYSLFDNFFSFH